MHCMLVALGCLVWWVPLAWLCPRDVSSEVSRPVLVPVPPAADSASTAVCPARCCRWCRFEFFYSAIDRPFFMQTGMDDLLRHCGLAGVTALTRKEWGLLRAGLGRPRRLSAAFLREERCRLEAWRRRCRAYYGRGGAGAAALAGAEGEEAELPRAVSVGQRVTARHPITRQLHDGGVLTAAHDCYRWACRASVGGGCWVVWCLCAGALGQRTLLHGGRCLVD